jgi:hypothetical protein
VVLRRQATTFLLLLFVVVVVVVVFATVVMGGKKVTVGILVVGWLVLARYARGGMFWRMPSRRTDRRHVSAKNQKSRCASRNNRNPFFIDHSHLFSRRDTPRTHKNTQQRHTHQTKLTAIGVALAGHYSNPTMSDIIGSVIIASAQSVAKVYVIGAVGYFAVKCE